MRNLRKFIVKNILINDNVMFRFENIVDEQNKLRIPCIV